MLTIGRLGTLAGIEPKTLRYYDRLGLVRPTARTPAGYRATKPCDPSPAEKPRELECYLSLQSESRSSHPNSSRPHSSPLRME